MQMNQFCAPGEHPVPPSPPRSDVRTTHHPHHRRCVVSTARGFSPHLTCMSSASAVAATGSTRASPMTNSPQEPVMSTPGPVFQEPDVSRSEEHTSEPQSHLNIVF